MTEFGGAPGEMTEFGGAWVEMTKVWCCASVGGDGIWWHLGRDDGGGVLGGVVVGEAGGADAGLVVEGGDFEAGVVGEDEKTWGGEGVGDGF
jgi:hypothetical protein